MITHNHRPWIRIGLTLIAPVMLGAATLLVAQSLTATEPTPQENQPQGAAAKDAGASIRNNSAADFSPKLPIQPARARCIRITDTGNLEGSPAWVIQNLHIYRALDQASSSSR